MRKQMDEFISLPKNMDESLLFPIDLPCENKVFVQLSDKAEFTMQKKLKQNKEGKGI